MERIHAAIGKGRSDDPAILGSDGRGVKNPTGTGEDGTRHILLPVDLLTSLLPYFFF